MKVLIINGSPRTEGSTGRAIKELEGELHKDDVETEVINVAGEPVRGCMECYACLKQGNKCAFGDEDKVNEIIEKAKKADGFVFCSPVYYSSPNGALLSVLDRVFYAAGGIFAGKPAAGITAARRAGTVAALDVIQKYFDINGMPTVPSQYWPTVFGRKPGDTEHDDEGLQTIRVLARNMAWMLKCFALGKEHGAAYPEHKEPRMWTHFIR